MPDAARRAEVRRATAETDITVAVDLDAGVGGAIRTGHGFVDHMLAQVQRHGRFELAVQAEGDLEVDVHHLAEDVGITLGQAVGKALGDRTGIERYGHAFVPMDETLAHVVLDLSGRPHIAFDPAGFEGDSHGFTPHHLRELLRGFANHAGATLHVRVLSGVESHHVCEAVTKAFARSLAAAVRRAGTELPSTKGLL